jgi:hypothetical protein
MLGFRDLDCRSAIGAWVSWIWIYELARNLGLGDFDFRIWVETWVSRVWISRSGLKLRFHVLGFEDLHQTQAHETEVSNQILKSKPLKPKFLPKS